MKIRATLEVPALVAVGDGYPVPNGVAAVRGAIPGGELWVDGLLVGQVIDVKAHGESVMDMAGRLVEFVGEEECEVRCVLHFNESVGVDVPTTSTVCDECGSYPSHLGTCSRSAMRGGSTSPTFPADHEGIALLTDAQRAERAR